MRSGCSPRAACRACSTRSTGWNTQATSRNPRRREAIAAIHAQDGIDPAETAVFDDDPRNLDVPHRLGMVTVHVAPIRDPRSHIHHHADDLA